jgi:lambda family phage tail tape measure protein
MAGRRTNQLGVLMQQTGYQVGDFAVQVQSGTNVMVALGQQATQLVGTFGMLSKSTKMVGIFAGLGIVVPVVTALAGAFMRSSDNAKTFDDTLSDLESSISNYSSAVKEARANTKDLRERFGNVSETMRPFLADLEELEKLKALNNLNSAFEKLEVSSKTFMDGVREALVGNVQAVKVISDRLGLTVDQYKEISLLTQEIKDAETSSDRMSAVNAVRDSLKETFGSLDNMTKEMQSFYLSLVKVVVAGGELKGETQKAADAVKGLNELLEDEREYQDFLNQRFLKFEEEKKSLQEQIQLNQKIIQFGKESAEVAQLKAQQAREQYEAQLRQTSLTEVQIQKLLELYDTQVETQQATEKTADSASKIGPALQSAIDQANAFASALGRAANNAASIGISTAGMRAERKALEKGMSQAEATAIAEATTAREKILSTVDRPGPQRDILAQEEFERTRQAVLERELEKSRLGKVKESLQPDTGGVGDGSAIDERQKMIDSVNRLISSYDKEYAKALKVEEATKLIAEAQRMGAIPANMEADQVLQDYIDSLEGAKDPMSDFVNNAAKQMSSAFMSIVDGSKSASDAFKDMARSILKQAFELAVINPIINSIFGGASGFTKLPTFANGAAFSNGKVTAFADGGVVNQPTMFPMANGAGLMGEAGPEAIMPLKRGKNGKLGVQVEGGSQQPVVINQSFNFAANGDESVKKIIAQEAPKIANLTQKQILDQRARGGAFKTTFG